MREPQDAPGRALNVRRAMAAKLCTGQASQGRLLCQKRYEHLAVNADCHEHDFLKLNLPETALVQGLSSDSMSRDTT